MKCLTLFTGVVVSVLSVSPASGQVTPPAAPVPALPPRPGLAPRPVRAPRAEPNWPDEKRWAFDDADRQREREDRQREEMDRQIERQSEIEDRQREQQASQLDRQRELEERQRDKMRSQEDRQREMMQEQGERQRQRELELEDRVHERSFDLVTPRALPPEKPPIPMIAPLPMSVWSKDNKESMVPDALDGAFLNKRPPEAWAPGDPADSLYRVAREALNRGDYRRAAQLFNDLTQRYPSSSYAFVSAYYEAFSRYRIGTTEELKAADRALQAIADRSAPRASGWRDDTDVNGLRTRIRGALAMRGDTGAADQLEETARKAGSSCDQEDLMVRVEALNALSQMDAAAALPILRRVLERRDECLVELRRRAVFMLARRGDADGATLLISTARNDPNVNVRAEAISYLPRMPGDAGLTALEDILRNADDERIQRTAVRAIMSSDNPRARTSLRGLLERRDASETLRLQVLEAYSRERATPDDAAYLRWLYPRSDSERMKGAIISALARIGGKDNQDWLAAVVRNTNESAQLRSAALQRLSRSDIPVADIGKMYDAADSRSMREQLISALASRKEPEATDKLIDIAKNSTDLEMRRLAINYLSRKNDPRATKLLMELIEK
jgi:HEAT repeat protein/TolA-binding protein